MRKYIILDQYIKLIIHFKVFGFFLTEQDEIFCHFRDDFSFYRLN